MLSLSQPLPEEAEPAVWLHDERVGRFRLRRSQFQAQTRPALRRQRFMIWVESVYAVDDAPAPRAPDSLSEHRC
jgi:hypothetical protein